MTIRNVRNQEQNMSKTGFKIYINEPFPDPRVRSIYGSTSAGVQAELGAY